MKYHKIILPILFLLLFVAFYTILKVIPPDYNDIHDHAAFARQMCTGEIPYTGNFLVYFLVNLFSAFTANVSTTEIVLCLLLAFAGTFRYYLTYETINKSTLYRSTSQKNSWYYVILSIAMLFVFAIPIPSFFLGDYFMYDSNYVPNVWHNSTILFLFPVALILFELSYKQLLSFDTKRNYWILLLVLLNLFIKPSFFFVIVCAYPILLLKKYRFRKEFWWSILPLFIGFVILIFQFIIIYKSTKPSSQETSSVIFLPFYKNPKFDNLLIIPPALLFSMLFPVLYSILNIRRLWKNQIFWYSFISFIISVLIYFFISESGPRAMHGNFYWQIVIASWICFFIALLALINDILTKKNTLKNSILITVFSVHVLMGILYLVKIIWTGNYY